MNYNFIVNLIGNRGKTTFCHLTLNKEKFKIFDYAVRNHYWYQMYIDDLPIWGK